ncbi:MAG: hypothetical protein HKN82_10140 [Akkermansiaceae bacterium]|nr:hypothetical protein [Akkermansiaceae bacterium]NNM30332.1 hypothetical protein [Akkermansiaceae bacterium]
MTKLAGCIFAAAVLVPGLASAQMIFATELVEIRAAPDAEVVEAEFPFKVGALGATIAEYDAPCSCLEAQISDGGRLAWDPGTSGTVKGVFKLGTFKGTVDKVIVLRMEGETVPSVKLTVRVEIPELVSVEPKTLFWNLGEPAVPQAFKLRMNGEKPLKIVDVSGTNEQFPFEMKTVKEGSEYELVVTPKSTEGRAFGLIRLRTDSEFVRHQRYQCFVVIRNKPAEAP